MATDLSRWRSGDRDDAARRAHNHDLAQRRRQASLGRITPAMRQRIAAEIAEGRTLADAAAVAGLTARQVAVAARADPGWRCALDEALMAGRDPALPHATQAGYRRGCRCPQCRAAHHKKPLKRRPYKAGDEDFRRPARLDDLRLPWMEDGAWLHVETGWVVVPATGHVYGTRHRHLGRRLGGLDGHGNMRANRKRVGHPPVTYRVHDLVWEVAHNRPVPAGYMVGHCNGDRTDCRIDNLLLVPRWKLTPEQVAEIRASPEDAKVLAERYDVSRDEIWHIRSDRKWRQQSGEATAVASEA